MEGSGRRAAFGQRLDDRSYQIDASSINWSITLSLLYLSSYETKNDGTKRVHPKGHVTGPDFPSVTNRVKYLRCEVVRTGNLSANAHAIQKGRRGDREGRRARRAMRMAERGKRRGIDQPFHKRCSFTKKNKNRKREGGKLWDGNRLSKTSAQSPLLAGDSPWTMALHPLGPDLFWQDRLGSCWLRLFVRRKLVDVVFRPEEYMNSNRYKVKHPHSAFATQLCKKHPSDLHW